MVGATIRRMKAGKAGIYKGQQCIKQLSEQAGAAWVMHARHCSLLAWKVCDLNSDYAPWANQAVGVAPTLMIFRHTRAPVLRSRACTARLKAAWPSRSTICSAGRQGTEQACRSVQREPAGPYTGIRCAVHNPWADDTNASGSARPRTW